MMRKLNSSSKKQTSISVESTAAAPVVFPAVVLFVAPVVAT